MSDRADSLWFKSLNTQQSGIIGQNEVFYIDVPATSTYITQGLPPADMDKRLVGKIERISIHSVGVSSRNLDILFLSAHSGLHVTGSLDGLIDSESFVTGMWSAIGGTTPRRTALSGLSIPYQDRECTKKFHLGIYNRTSTGIAANALTIEFSWRPDRGEQ